MPVPSRRLKRKMIVAAEVATQTPDQHDQKKDGTDSDMKTMKTGQHEERGAIDTCAERQPHFCIGLMVFNALQEDESKTQKDREGETDDQLATIILE